MYVQEIWGSPVSGYIEEEGENRETKTGNIDQAIQEHIANGEWGEVFSRLADQAPPERIALLWDILMLADLDDYKQLEEKIYLYGRSLGVKDSVGRIVFTRMAMILHKAQM